MNTHAGFRYTPRYCEENIWHLAGDPRLGDGELLVALITGEGPYRPFWFQRCMDDPRVPVWWDYHVILLQRQDVWQVWDLDSTLELPVAANAYLAKTFLNSVIGAGDTDVVLRLVPADYYVEHFSSDRAHMRLPSGEWLAEPPTWPMILRNGRPNLLEWLDIGHTGPGRLLALTECLREFGAGDRNAVSPAWKAGERD